MDHRWPIGPGARFVYEGDLLEVVEMRPGPRGNYVTVKKVSTGQVRAISMNEVLAYRSDESNVGKAHDEPEDVAATILAMASEEERRNATERAAHVQEVLTGYRKGSPELADCGEPKAEYLPSRSLNDRYKAKAAELGVDARTVQRMVKSFREHGEAGLIGGRGIRVKRLPSVDGRWREAVVEILVEHAGQSRPSRTAVIRHANARVKARYGLDVVPIPSRATAFRLLEELEKKYPTFRLSTKRNRDIAERNPGVYGKLRPTRPGEYMLMDTTRLDVFAMDPITLQWCQVELTVAMDWYTRCITGLRLTPVSTKSVDVATVLYQTYRPPAASTTWPTEATWPEHGIPRSVLLDKAAMVRAQTRAVGPAIVTDTLVVDHGKVYVSEHLTSVCQRMGISIQPARLRTGRDKGPVERFFRTVREDVLQYLPGYKGPDIHSRGANPETDAHFYIDELEWILREWIAVVYHRRPHSGLVHPGLPRLELSPTTMFEQGLARAGYLEAPSDPDLAYEFLAVVTRTIQPTGIEISGRRYNSDVLNQYRNCKSPYRGGLWPVHYHPDDISRVYFRDPETNKWHTLMWEHAGGLTEPFSEDMLAHGRALAKKMYAHPNDELAMELLLERWNLGLGRSPAERRIALRLSREDDLLRATNQDGINVITTLPAVQNALHGPSTATVIDPEPSTADDEYGDDDLDDDPDNFYADAWEDA
jgi:transposase InsO family protein